MRTLCLLHYGNFMQKGKRELQQKGETIPMPSRIDRFGLIISLEFTRNMSPIYRWFVGTKTLHNSSSSLSFCSNQLKNQ